MFVSDDQEYISQLLCNEATLCFFDPHYTESKLKKRSVSFTIVFASTNPVQQKIFKQCDFATYYMPVWTFKELEECRTLCYPDKDSISFKKEYARWGGSARCLFTKTPAANMTRMESFLCSQNLEVTIADMEGIHTSEKPYDQHQWLVHVFIEGNDYTKRLINWPSQFVLGMVNEALIKHAKSWKNIVNCILGGKVYEEAVRLKLTGNTNTIIASRLSSKTSETKALPCTRINFLYFSNMDSFRGDEFVQDVLYVPVERNKESRDFVCNNWIFQATVSLNFQSNLMIVKRGTFAFVYQRQVLPSTNISRES